MSLETEVEILKKEVQDIKQIHLRLDTAIGKISDVSNSINRMLAVHEEKLSRQEEAQDDLNKTIETRRMDVAEQLQILHKRISDQTEKINIMRQEINDRVGVLEKWRHIILGGSIVVGFLLHKFLSFPS
mgnify:FL=1|tara:strand:- start:314 stop:700 length:387 start_codon:yes stop_codon:yes gene_type:complete